MKARLASIVMVAMLGILVLTGCEVLPEEYPTPTPMPTPSGTRKPTHEVKRGDVISIIKVMGRVAATHEETFFFRQAGRLKGLYASYNAKVKKGDLLADLETGMLDTQIAQAKVDVEIAQLKVDAKKASRPELADLKKAESAVASAEASLESARANLAEMKKGPKVSDIKDAESGIASAQENLSAAQEKLSALRKKPNETDVRSAELSLEEAKASLHSVQVERDAACSGNPKGTACNSANARVGAAINRVDIAQAKLDEAKIPPTPEEIKVAEDAVASAQANLAAAQARLAQSKVGTSAGDITAAEKSVQSAEQSLESAKLSYEAEKAKVNPETNHDLQIMEKEVERAKLSLEALERQWNEARVVAPFDGVVISTHGRAGDLVQSFQEVVTLADPKGLEVRADMTPIDLSRCAPGMEVSLTIQAYPGKVIKGTVIELPTNEPGATGAAEKKAVRMSFESPGPGAKLDDTANVTIITEKRENVIVVPNTVVRTFGERVFVQIFDEGRKREVDVKLGLRGDEETEVLSGLKEGQLVIVK